VEPEPEPGPEAEPEPPFSVQLERWLRREEPKTFGDMTDVFGDKGFADVNEIHSSFAWDAGARAYVVMTDNFESKVVQRLGAGFPKWIPHTHISHFAPSTIERLIKRPDCRVVKRASYTPWELTLREFHYRARGIRVTPNKAFDLASTLQTEMSGSYRMFGMRRFINKMWAEATLSSNLDGALMFCLMRKELL
jgi:hypothetical protein